MTGSGLHFAYDGMQAGIIIPNTLKCHLDKIPEESLDYPYYTEKYNEWYERETDYPSLGDLRLVLA